MARVMFRITWGIGEIWAPQEVFEFFDRMHDPESSDDDVFKSKLEFQLQDMTCVVGYGGLHSALPNYVEVSEE